MKSFIFAFMFESLNVKWVQVQMEDFFTFFIFPKILTKAYWETIPEYLNYFLCLAIYLCFKNIYSFSSFTQSLNSNPIFLHRTYQIWFYKYVYVYMFAFILDLIKMLTCSFSVTVLEGRQCTLWRYKKQVLFLLLMLYV